MWACFILARVQTPYSPVRKRERKIERERERERKKEREREIEREGEREKEIKRERVFIFKRNDYLVYQCSSISVSLFISLLDIT